MNFELKTINFPMSPFFSIIIPVYNVAPYLRECLDSVLAQTFSDWEAICVDDGSTDGSGAILDEYAAKDKRFHVVHRANAGPGESRNTGLNAASGEWISFIDGDDVFAPFALQRLYDTAKRHENLDLIRFRYEEFQNGDALVWHESSENQTKEIDISHAILMENFCVYMWEVVYKRGTTQNVRFPKYKRGEDRVFVNTIQLTKAFRMLSTRDVLYGYRIRQGSAMHSLPSQKVLCDEMDHRLDIMEMIDTSGKNVDYTGNDWLEGYFTKHLPLMTFDCHDDAPVVKNEWRKRLPRLLKCKGLSTRGRILIWLSSNRTLRPIGDFFIFTLQYLRYKAPLLKPISRFYRRIMRHGEFAPTR